MELINGINLSGYPIFNIIIYGLKKYTEYFLSINSCTISPGEYFSIKLFKP